MPKPGSHLRPTRSHPGASQRPCLSGRGQPHAFPSDHPAHRICPRCAAKLALSLRQYGPQALRPVRGGEEQ